MDVVHSRSFERAFRLGGCRHQGAEEYVTECLRRADCAGPVKGGSRSKYDSIYCILGSELAGAPCLRKVRSLT